MKAVGSSDPPRPAISFFRRLGAREVSSAWLLVGIIGWLALDNLLLWRFLNFAPPWLYGVALLALCGACLTTGRVVWRSAWPGPTAQRLALCAVVALALFLLGGEGRFFYANLDWQVRDAVLRDLVVNPWPYAYTKSGTAEVLRAPIGMFLLPALAGKAWGVRAAELILLLQNTLFLTALLGLASTLFESTRCRTIALLVFVLFSGMDIVGQVWTFLRNGIPIPDHLEAWSQGLQFSSHITQAFWVPQHALAGWAGAVLWLLWKQGRLSIGILGATLPLLALWSPLGLMGAMPLAAYAGIAALVQRKVGLRDIAMTAATLVFTAPALLYLSAAGGTVGVRSNPITVKQYLLFETVEVLPYLTIVGVLGFRSRFGRGTLPIVAACLLLFPFVQVGESLDFVMRASITALAILSILVAEALGGHAEAGAKWEAPGRAMLILCLLVGSATGMMEIRRSLANPPSPSPRCSFHGAFDQSFFGAFGKSTYLAPLGALPSAIRPVGAFAQPGVDPAYCWERPWVAPKNLIKAERRDRDR